MTVSLAIPLMLSSTARPHLRGAKSQESLRLGVQGPRPNFERLYIDMEAVLGDLRFRDALKGELRPPLRRVFDSIPVAELLLGLAECPQYRMGTLDVRRRVTEHLRPKQRKGDWFSTVERDLDAT